MAAIYLLLLLIFRFLHLFHYTWTKLHPWTIWFIVLTALIVLDFLALASSRRRRST